MSISSGMERSLGAYLRGFETYFWQRRPDRHASGMRPRTGWEPTYEDLKQDRGVVGAVGEAGRWEPTYEDLKLLGADLEKAQQDMVGSLPTRI